MVTPTHLIREVVVFLDSIHLSPLWPPIVVLPSIFAVATDSAMAPAAFFLLALLAEPLEVETILSGVAVPVVVDAERTGVRLLPWRLWRVLPRVHRVRLDRENCGGLALGVGVFLAGLGLLREVLLVLCLEEENALFSLSALVSDVEEPHHCGEVLGVDAELLEHPVVGDAFFEGRDDHVVGDVRDLVADLAEVLYVSMLRLVRLLANRP